MIIFPAIDLKDGRCVRLRQGDLAQETVYSDDPAAMARHWAGLGAQWLHVVDLNGAVEGEPRNAPQIEAIVRAVRIPVQVGGGIRSLETIRRYVAALGVRRVVLGTAALQDRSLLEKATADFPARVLVGIDARGGKVAVKGWTDVSGTTARDLLRTLSGFALAGVIYTDIARDGMLGGPNLEALKEVTVCSSSPVIASGGVTRVEDIRAIRALGSRVEGVIIGKALYEGKLTLPDAIKAASGQ
jgi:phosphoribosylformimino-5-aminoimidazole carboxamide ribotide isomerase